jgi:geranylgeranyl diphosphate synthase type I
MMKIESLLERHSREVERSLMDLWKREVERAQDYHPFIRGLYESAREFTLRGGMRIASFTTSMVSRGYGYGGGETIRAVCDAVELYRHSILVHDDLVDGDEMRRGRPTIHRKYGEMRDERMGIGASIFLGNIMYSMAIGRVLNSTLGCGTASALASELLRANIEVNESQTLDVFMEGAAPDRELWEIMASRRAASLFRATLRMGGILSGAKGDLDLLGRAGEEIGYVFDIQDDIIDTLASRDDYGREPGSDLRTLKRPIHIIMAMERASPEQRAGIGFPDADLADVKELLSETGALEEARKMADGHRSRALELLSSTEMDRETCDLFSSLMDYIGKSLKWYGAPKR